MLVILDGFTCHIEVTHIMINCGDDDAGVIELISRATFPSQISKQNTMTLSVTDDDHGDDGQW